MLIFLHGDTEVGLLELVTVLYLVTYSLGSNCVWQVPYSRAHVEVTLGVGLSDGNVPSRPEYCHCS